MTYQGMHDVHSTLLQSAGDYGVRFDQYIPDSFLDGLKDSRNASSSAPAGDFHRVASVPVAVVEKWLREGFDIYKEPAAAVVKRLKAEELTAFLATTKRI